ncbi:type II toxin-antitoxin system CcdA family antitoxin [Nitratifractor sp.]|uniref:type II toxin-antitoxin system CcdA family antitoxin n=1 Tax=Nitratifractor sp. TaxID=2268144 RepID=UPI0025FE924E|nr:type II toxin-antitoxin system CcdA family antitoxin [Nitratifractor sp.]
MAISYSEHSIEKVTFNLDKNLKEKVMALKKEMGVSLSSIYNEAIADYLKRKELERWEEAASKAVNDQEYRSFGEVVGEDDGGFHEY